VHLSADIGGTNARLALADVSGPLGETIRSYRNDDFESFDDVLAQYLKTVSGARIMRMVVAVAGPVTGRTGRLTNRDWTFSADSLEQSIGAIRVDIINDLTALGYAVPDLRREHLRALVGDGAKPAAHQTMLVVGIGTGFNVSPVIPVGGNVICPSVEAGHASMPLAVIHQGDPWINGFADEFPTVEHLFSGRGFRRFLDLTLDEVGVRSKPLGADGSGEAPAPIDLYAMLIGRLLRDLSMAYLPTGGIFLAGGVARSIMSTAAVHQFAGVFSEPSRFLATPPPVWTIIEDSAALYGCAYVAAHQ